VGWPAHLECFNAPKHLLFGCSRLGSVRRAWDGQAPQAQLSEARGTSIAPSRGCIQYIIGIRITWCTCSYLNAPGLRLTRSWMLPGGTPTLSPCTARM
jgi:hypothetical protein